MHTTPTNREIENTISSMIITKYSWEKTCNLYNVKDILYSKRNDTPNKHIANHSNKFINFYKSLEKIKISIAKKYLALALQIHYENKTF